MWTVLPVLMVVVPPMSARPLSRRLSVAVAVPSPSVSVAEGPGVDHDEPLPVMVMWLLVELPNPPTVALISAALVV